MISPVCRARLAERTFGAAGGMSLTLLRCTPDIRAGTCRAAGAFRQPEPGILRARFVATHAEEPRLLQRPHRRFAGPPKLIIDLAQAGNASRSGVPFCLSENRWSNRQLGIPLLDAIYLELHALAEMTAVTETGS